MATKVVKTTYNSKRWQDNSDGWVKTMHESREKKEQAKEECNHPIEEWCENCQYNQYGTRYDF